MNMNFIMVGPPLISLVAGIAILIWPRLLSYIVAFYLILFGLATLPIQTKATSHLGPTPIGSKVDSTFPLPNT